MLVYTYMCAVARSLSLQLAALHFAEEALRERHVQLNVGQRPVVAPVHQPVDQFAAGHSV